MAALARLVSFLILAGLSGLAAAGAGWHQLTAAQQEALTPLAPSWDTLPAEQRQALLDLSTGYGALDARGQRLFHERLLQWTLLTPAQRQLARENFRRLRNMPAAQQAQIKQRWQQACEPLVKP